LDGKTPYEILFKAKPSYDHIRIFRCLCYVYTHQKRKGKFGARSQKCVFIGYPFGEKGWRVYDLDNGHIFTSRDVVFCEDHFPFFDKSMLPGTLDQNIASTPPVHDYETEPMFSFTPPTNHATGPAVEEGPVSSIATNWGGLGVDGPVAGDDPTPGPDMLPSTGPTVASPRAGITTPSGPHESTINASAA